MKISKQFEDTIKKLVAVPESEYESKETIKLFVLAYQYAPPEMKDRYEAAVSQGSAIDQFIRMFKKVKRTTM